MSGVVFGTDGVRGEAGRFPVLPEVARRLGAALVGLGHRAVVVGRDTRPSGPSLEEALIHGVVAGGGRIVRAGVVPTAAVQIALAEGRGDVGVMLTASHNPAADNGFKVLLAGGRKPDDEAATQIERAIARTEDPGPRASDAEVDHGPARAWRARLPEPPEGRRLVVDLANGSLSAHRDAIAAHLRGAVFVGADGGAINDGCGSEHLDALRRHVVQHGADAGLAVDGDADRVRLVDAAGEEVPGDTITWLLARASRVTSLAVTVMSTTALEAGLPGVRVVRTPVGDRHVRHAMDTQGIPLGAEDSGHVLFADHPGGDGLFAGLRALSAAFAAAPTLAAAVAGFTPFPRRLTKVAAATRRPLSELPELSRATTEAEVALGAGGRVFLRWSGTEPVLRLLVEGRDAEVVARASDAVTDAARRVLA